MNADERLKYVSYRHPSPPMLISKDGYKKKKKKRLWAQHTFTRSCSRRCGYPSGQKKMTRRRGKREKQFNVFIKNWLVTVCMFFHLQALVYTIKKKKIKYLSFMEGVSSIGDLYQPKVKLWINDFQCRTASFHVKPFPSHSRAKSH